MPNLTTNPIEKINQSLIDQNSDKIAFIAITIAAVACMKHTGLSAALRFYPSGGAGLNIYKYSREQNKPLRRFALDYHPIWDHELKAKVSRLHYHKGESFNQIKKHRPYDGGW